MTRWLDTLPPLDRELGFYLLLASLVTYALARLVQDACQDQDREKAKALQKAEGRT